MSPVVVSFLNITLRYRRVLRDSSYNAFVRDKIWNLQLLIRCLIGKRKTSNIQHEAQPCSFARCDGTILNNNNKGSKLSLSRKIIMQHNINYMITYQIREAELALQF